MRIGINGTPLFGRRGVRRYTQQLIQHLARIDKENYYALFFICFRYGAEKIPSFPDNKNIVVSRCRIPGKIFEPLSHRLGFPSVDLFTGKTDVFHNTEENPLSCRRAVYLQTIHGMHHKVIPQLMNPAYAALQEKYFHGMLGKADCFAAVSQAVKNELMEHYGIPGEKIAVVYPGIEEHFRVLPEKENIKRFLKEKFSIDGDYILYVGGMDRHKNLNAVMDTFSLCRTRNIFDGRLVLVGPTEKGMTDYFQNLKAQIQRNSLSEHVKLIGYIDEESLVKLYNAAQCLLFPSAYEGCSVTPLEAMACGCPVITSDIPSLRESTGGAALLANPSSIDGLCSAMDKILHDSELEKNLKSLGLKWSAQFNYNKMAHDFLSLYKEINARKN